MRLAMAVTALALTLVAAILLVVRLRMDTLAAKEDDCQFMLTSSECANYQPNMCAVDGEEGVCLVHFDCPLERQLANKPPAYTDPCPEHYFCCSQAHDKRRSAQVDADCSMHPEGVWSAAVLWRNGSSWEFQCMATFLSERVLLATAGCVERLAAHGKDFAKGMKVRVDVGPEWQQQDANVVRVVLAGTRLAALLLLDTTSLPSRHEHHACLPNIGDDFSNSLCLLIGYGEDGNKYYQEKRYLPTNECEQNTEEHLVCAENTSEDLCLVSAGSPLVCDLDEVWVLAGFSLGCGDSKDRYLRSNLAVAWADLYLQNWTQTVPLKPIATR